MKKHYLALTIGPIHRTLAATCSTKAMWSASYLFSWIMRHIIEKINKDTVTFLKPFQPNAEILNGKHQVGLFPDRLILEYTDKKPDVKQIVQEVIEDLAKKISNDFKEKHIPITTDIQVFLQQYLQLYALHIELNDPNPVATIDQYLNGYELQTAFVAEEPTDIWSIFFEDLYYNFFIEDEFYKKGFRSTVEIATHSFQKFAPEQYDKAVKDLRKQETETNDQKKIDTKQQGFIKKIRELEQKRFKLCHKYIAIVQADGDNIGHLFGKLGATDRDTMSALLHEFAVAAVRAVTEYGGVPVYAGGDDLLCFAPVSVENMDGTRKTIFDLFATVDAVFKEKIVDNIPENIKPQLHGKMPTMSYGVAMSYYKYPLGEALGKANELLFEDIKKGNRRNGIGWRVLKHSGMGFGSIFEKNTASFDQFNVLLQKNLPKGEQEGKFLSSIIFKLESLEGLFQGTVNSPDFENHVHYIFFNNFNESIHRENGQLSAFLRSVRDLVVVCFAENAATHIEKSARVQQNLQKVYAALRFVHFIHTEDKNDELR